MSEENGRRPTYDNRITTGNVLTIVAILVPMLASIFVFYLDYERRLTTAEGEIRTSAAALGGRIDGIQTEIVTRVDAAKIEREDIKRRLVELESWRNAPAGPPPFNR